MKKMTKAILPLAAACLILPAAGIAGLPKPKDPTIVVPKSIGGVKLGMKYKKADKAWGKSGDCNASHGSGSCAYTKGTNYEKGTGDIIFLDGKVTDLAINAGTNSKGKLVVKGPIAKFQTPEGIGLGDKGSKVKKAYKKTQHVKGGAYLVPGKGKSTMYFAVNEDDKITSISLADGGHQG